MARRRPEPARGDIVDLTHDGRGVAMAAGKRVFVSDALAGERVDYQVVRKKRSYDEARTLAVVEPAAERVEPRCAVFGVCGGCTLQHLEHEAQLAHKQNVLAENLRRIGELTDVPLAAPLRGPVWHYRRRARLGVKSVHGKGRVLVGFRERGKPYITDMQRCEVLSEPLATLPGVLAELVDTLECAGTDTAGRADTGRQRDSAGVSLPGRLNGGRSGSSGRVSQDQSLRGVPANRRAGHGDPAVRA